MGKEGKCPTNSSIDQASKLLTRQIFSQLPRIICKKIERILDTQKKSNNKDWMKQNFYRYNYFP